MQLRINDHDAAVEVDRATVCTCVHLRTSSVNSICRVPSDGSGDLRAGCVRTSIGGNLTREGRG